MSHPSYKGPKGSMGWQGWLTVIIIGGAAVAYWYFTR